MSIELGRECIEQVHFFRILGKKCGMVRGYVWENTIELRRERTERSISTPSRGNYAKS